MLKQIETLLFVEKLTHDKTNIKYAFFILYKIKIIFYKLCLQLILVKNDLIQLKYWFRIKRVK